MTRVAALLCALLLPLLAPAVLVAPARAAEPGPPTVAGTARVGEVLTASPGDPAPTAPVWRWLRDGVPLPGPRGSGASLRLVADDLGARMSVRVGEAGGPTATSAATAPVAPGRFEVGRSPWVAGEPRWTRTLTARLGAWRPWPATVRVQWLRDGRPVPGATARRFTPRPQDVGHRVAVRVTGTSPGYAARSVTSRPVRVAHLVPVRRAVTYTVRTRGRVTADVARFARLAQATFDDPRGWRAAGVSFRRVARGGDFTLVLATPEQLPRFSPVCSVAWSCRVGRHVVVNQLRWQRASPAWNRAGGTLRDYRHMVVNHETGHWLGRGHRGCPGPGRPAPVMMQQSKGLGGCRFNPWPTPAER